MKIDHVMSTADSPDRGTAHAILEFLCGLDASLTDTDCWLRWITRVARTYLRDPNAAAAALGRLQALSKLSRDIVEHERIAERMEEQSGPIEQEIERLIAEPKAPAGGRAKAPRKRARSTRTAAKRRASR